MKITFLAADGCLASGISGLLDMFSIANMWHAFYTGESEAFFETEIVSLGGKPVLCSGCMQMLPHRPLEHVAETDFLLIPPFLPLSDPVTTDSSALGRWIINTYQSRTPVAAVCTGTFLLAETGLLNGKIATTNWQFARKFKHRFPEVLLNVEHLLTEEDGLICTGAATSSFNLGLMIIGRYGSKELASACSKAMLLDPNRDSQSPYCIWREEREHNDLQVLRAQRYLEEHFAKNLKIDDIANHVCMSPRHFKRRFKKATGHAPIQYLQMVRLEAAKKQLETTLQTIEQITQHIGYEDSSTFRRLFKNHTQLSPRAYRDKFGSMKIVKPSLSRV